MKTLQMMLNNFLNKRVELITMDGFVCTGIFKLNDTIMYDECKYIVEDGITKYYFNEDDIATIGMLPEEDKNDDYRQY